MTRAPVIGAATISAMVTALAGCVSPTPMTASQSFSNPVPRTAESTAAARARKRQPGCPLIVDELVDARSDPSMLGVVAGRAVHGPADANAWLRNVVEGFESRGIDVSFDTNPTQAASPLVATLTLRIAWVADLHTSKTANAVWHLALRRDAHMLVDADFRGADAVINWSSNDGELQRMVDRALAKSLDAMAVEIIASCGR